MTAATKYLESEKVEELANQLRREGYDVTLRPSGADDGYDLVATKPGKKIAFEVKANSELGASAARINELRRKAYEQGFDEFRLVVVNPPHQTVTRIEGLDLKLAKYLDYNLPQEIRHLYQHIQVHRVSGIEIDSVSISQDGTRVVGTAVVNIQIHSGNPPTDAEPPIDEGSGVVDYAGGAPVIDDYGTEWLGWDVDLPFSFDAKLDRDLEIVTAYGLSIDVSSLH